MTVIRDTPILPRNVEDKYKVQSCIRPLARNGHPLSPQCSSTYYLQLARTWDRVLALI